MTAFYTQTLKKQSLKRKLPFIYSRQSTRIDARGHTKPFYQVSATCKHVSYNYRNANKTDELIMEII